MKVPGAVQTVFDRFPLVLLPAYENEKTFEPGEGPGSALEPLLSVYNTDEDGLPLDPRCLAAVAVLTLMGRKPKIETASPYISASETLPLYRTGAKVAASLDQIIRLYEQGDELSLTPEFTIYRALVDTWLDDAWHATIMDPQNIQARHAVYAPPEHLPWPFSRIANNQLEDHLEARNARFKQASGDDYVCTLSSMHRAAMALSALQEAVSTPIKGDPAPIDLLVFAYTWPIVHVVPESALATLVPPLLQQHAQEVRSFLINSTKSFSLSKTHESENYETTMRTPRTTIIAIDKN